MPYVLMMEDCVQHANFLFSSGCKQKKRGNSFVSYHTDFMI